MRNASFFVVAVFVVLFCGCTEEQMVSMDIIGGGNVNLYSLRPKALQIVRQSLVDNQSNTISPAIEVVATVGLEELMPTITKLLSSESISVRFAAAVAIGDMGYVGGKYSVKRLLEDQDDNAKIAAAYALTKLGGRELGDIIRSSLNSKDPTVRANAAMLIGKLGDKNDIELLYNALIHLDGSYYRAKIQIVEALAMLGDEGIYRTELWPLLISKYADDRAIGVRAMGALNTFESKKAIMTMLYDDSSEVRLGAAEQLAQMGDFSGKSEILNYLKGRSTGVRDKIVADSIAAKAIGRIGTGELKVYLPKLLSDRSAIVRISAAQSVLLLTQ